MQISLHCTDSNCRPQLIFNENRPNACEIATNVSSVDVLNILEIFMFKKCMQVYQVDNLISNACV